MHFTPEQEREAFEHIRVIEESLARMTLDIRESVACCDRILKMGQRKGPTGEEQ